MTDSEKLDLLLTEIQSIKGELQDMKSKMQSMKEKIDKLSMGQLEIKKESYMLNRKISDTYNVALDVLGTSAENRTWLEKGALIELFFQFVASPVLHYFFLQNRIILMRFYLSFMWFQSWCTQIVPTPPIFNNHLCASIVKLANATCSSSFKLFA